MASSEATRRNWMRIRRSIGYFVCFAFYGCLLFGMIQAVALVVYIISL